MLKKVVLAGGTGFVGQYFEKHFRNLGYEVRIISRQLPAYWLGRYRRNKGYDR
jgi:uncharacterized protein